MTGRVRERFTRADGELLLFPHGHDLLGNWTREGQRRAINERDRCKQTSDLNPEQRLHVTTEAAAARC